MIVAKCRRVIIFQMHFNITSGSEAGLSLLVFIRIAVRVCVCMCVCKRERQTGNVFSVSSNEATLNPEMKETLAA